MADSGKKSKNIQKKPTQKKKPVKQIKKKKSNVKKIIKLIILILFIIFLFYIYKTESKKIIKFNSAKKQIVKIINKNIKIQKKDFYSKKLKKQYDKKGAKINIEIDKIINTSPKKGKK